MRIFRIITIGVFSSFCTLGLIDFLIIRLGEKKDYVLSQKDSTIQAKLAKGILVYGNPNIFFFKWEIDSIKQVN